MQERQRRQRLSDDEKRDVLARWKASGLGAKRFARQEGMSAANLWRWTDALGERSTESRDTTKRASISFAPVSVIAKNVHVDSNARIEVVIDERIVIRIVGGADAATVGALVRELARVSSC